MDNVRVHNNTAANNIANNYNARAVTFGDNIWLRGNESPEDTKLMVHELAHVAQQRNQPMIQLKTSYQSQLENTFQRSPYIEEGKTKYHIDKNDMCNVTTLAMQLIKLIGNETNTRDAVTSLLIRSKYPKSKRDKLEGMTIADLLITRFYQIKKWKAKLELYFPDRNKDGKLWQRFKEMKDKSGSSFFQMGLPLIIVGLEVLQEANIQGEGESISSKKYALPPKATWSKANARAYFEGKLKNELDSGSAILMSTKLTGGHIVHLNSVISGPTGGVLIDDPFGIRLGFYMKNNSDFRPVILRERNRHFNILKRRLMHNTPLWNELQTLKKGDRFPKNVGERNFYNWEEVAKFKIGKFVNILSKGIAIDFSSLTENSINVE